MKVLNNATTATPPVVMVAAVPVKRRPALSAVSLELLALPPVVTLLLLDVKLVMMATPPVVMVAAPLVKRKADGFVELPEQLALLFVVINSRSEASNAMTEMLLVETVVLLSVFLKRDSFVLPLVPPVLPYVVTP